MLHAAQRQVALPRFVPGSLPTPISLRELWPWALFGLALLFVVYFVGMDQGALSAVPGQYVHEFVHDGRHLLGFPCH